MTDTLLTLFFLGVLLIITGGTGRYLLQRLGCSFTCKTEELSFSFAVGFGTLILVVLAMGLSHLLYVGAIYAIILTWMVVGSKQSLIFLGDLKQRLIAYRVDHRSFYFWLAILTALGMGLTLIRALTPPYGATDPLAYQMALPKIFLRNHYLSFESTITGSLYPTNMGMLYIVALALRDGTLAQMMHWLMGILCLGALIGFGTRYFSRETGIWAAAIFSFIPVIVIFGPLGYVDVGLCFFQFMAFWAIANWLDQPDRPMLLLAGILTGLAMGFKHQGIATVFVGLIVVFGGGLTRREGWVGIFKKTGLYLAIALGLSAPWYIRSYALAGNPIWPLANSFFGGLPFNLVPEILANTSGDSTQSGLGKLLPSMEWLRRVWKSISPWAWTFEPGGGQKAIGVYFVALMPGILLYLRQTRTRWLLAFCICYYLLLIRVLHSNPRYGLVLFAFASLVCGHVAERMCASRLKLIPYILKAGFLFTVVANLTWEYFLAQPVLNVVSGRETKTFFLQNREPNYRVMEFINQNLPTSAKVLMQGIVKGFYSERPYLWDHPYQATLDYAEFSTAEELLQKMRELGISHVVRMIRIPPIRRMYPQYFQDSFHEEFRKKYLKLLYYDESYVLFEVNYGAES